MHVLDRPIWNALTTLQSHLAEVHGQARRFVPTVTSLAACAPEALADLAALLAPGEVTGLLFELEARLPDGLERVDVVDVLQMLHVDPAAVATLAAPATAETLAAPDVAEMIDLARRMRPGPFAERSIELGPFLGVREQGRLVAMAGLRMRVPGH